MNTLVTPAQMRTLDRAAAEKTEGGERTLMTRAGAAVAELCLEKTEKENNLAVILCGCGNNGGDGYVVAARLARHGRQVAVFEYQPERARTGVAAEMRQDAEKAGVAFYPLCDDTFCREALWHSAVVVDAVFGTGFHGALPEELAALFAYCAGSPGYRIAVDCPSGIDGTSGAAPNGAFPAQETVAMSYLMRGDLLLPARQYVGRLRVAHIGIEGAESREFCLDAGDIRAHFAPRKMDSNKGSYGRALLLCGSEGMPGAALLALSAALRAGAGLCELAAPASVVAAAAPSCPEALYLPVPDVARWTERENAAFLSRAEGAAALLLGPGLGASRPLAERISALLSTAGAPLVLDADALNAVAAYGVDLSRKRREVLVTPHPKEFARLLVTSVAEVQSDRIAAARRYAAENDVTVLLKGADTLIVAPDGTLAVNPTGNAGLAKGGSGDVLAGLICGLAATGKSLFDAACIGAWLHGAAGDRLRAEYGEAAYRVAELPLAVAEELGALTR